MNITSATTEATISIISLDNEYDPGAPLMKSNQTFDIVSASEKDSIRHSKRTTDVFSTENNNWLGISASSQIFISNNNFTPFSVKANSNFVKSYKEYFDNSLNHSLMITNFVEKSVDKWNTLSTSYPKNKDTHLTQTTKSNASMKVMQRNRNMKTKSVLKALVNGGFEFNSTVVTTSFEGNKTLSGDTYMTSTTSLSTFNRSNSVQEHFSEQTFLIATKSTSEMETGATSATKQYPIGDLRERMKSM